jgi:hypothetical protein
MRDPPPVLEYQPREHGPGQLRFDWFTLFCWTMLLVPFLLLLLMVALSFGLF